MKKIILSNPNADVIKFLVRGQRNSATAVELEIDAEGVLVDESDAKIVAERLGGNVIISDVDVRKAAAELLKAVTPEEIAAEEARRAALTDEERAAEDEAKAKAEADAKETDRKSVV